MKRKFLQVQTNQPLNFSARILVIEDDKLLRDSIAKILQSVSYEVETAHDGYIAIEKVKAASWDLIISDIRIPGIDGVESVGEIKKILPSVKTILITAYADDSAPVKALNLGVDAYLMKPFRMQDLLDLVRKKLLEAKREADLLRGINHIKERYQKLLAIFVEHDIVEDAINYIEEHESRLIDDEIKAIIHGEELSVRSDKQGWRSWITLLQLGNAYRYAGEKEIARQAYMEIVEKVPADENELHSEARHGLALLALDENNVYLAQNLLDEAVKLVGGKVTKLNMQLFFLKGRLLRLSGDKKGAEEAFLAAKKLISEWGYTREQVGVAVFLAALALERGDESSALSWIGEINANLSGGVPYVLLNEPDITKKIVVFALEKQLNIDKFIADIFTLGEKGKAIINSISKEITDPAMQKVFTNGLQIKNDSQRHRLKIFSFGDLRVLRKGELIGSKEWKRKKTKSLLLYLLLNTAPSIDKLLDALWPDASSEQGKTLLYTTVHTLRKILGDEDGAVIVALEGSYQFKKDASNWVDFHEFTNSLDLAKKARAANDKQKYIFALHDAEQYY